jgi:DNA-binding Lrp family transcriptional regulator
MDRSSTAHSGDPIAVHAEEIAPMVNIDRLDSHLMSLLSADARTGVVELAAALGVTRHTVQSRLRRLEEQGLLSGFVPRIDLAAMGITVQAFAALALEQGRLDAVVDGLAEIPQVLEVHATTGREDLLVRLATTSHAALQALIQQIVAMPGVRHSDTSLALTTPLPYRVSPLLTEVTREAGWGRSTPLPPSD